MSLPTETTKPPKSRTKIIFDLSDILTPEEIEKFEQSAKAAGTDDLTEHFLNLNLKKESLTQ